MGKAFADRWGVPVRAGSADSVALLDVAIEELAALAGDPVADADAAVAADDSLVLGGYLLVGLLGWSRVAVRDHTVLQVVGGSVLGAAAALLAYSALAPG